MWITLRRNGSPRGFFSHVCLHLTCFCMIGFALGGGDNACFLLRVSLRAMCCSWALHSNFWLKVQVLVIRALFCRFQLLMEPKDFFVYTQVSLPYSLPSFCFLLWSNSGASHWLWLYLNMHMFIHMDLIFVWSISLRGCGHDGSSLNFEGEPQILAKQTPFNPDIKVLHFSFRIVVMQFSQLLFH